MKVEFAAIPCLRFCDSLTGKPRSLLLKAQRWQTIGYTASGYFQFMLLVFSMTRVALLRTTFRRYRGVFVVMALTITLSAVISTVISVHLLTVLQARDMTCSRKNTKNALFDLRQCDIRSSAGAQPAASSLAYF
jgi:hypothetical protein